MGRKAEVSLYRLFNVEGTHRYVRIVKSGRGWAPKTEAVGEPGAYYLRFLKNGRRTFESVGDDIHVALQEQKARQQALDTSTEPIVPAVPPPKTLREHISQFAAKKDGLTKTERRRANTWRYPVRIHLAQTGPIGGKRSELTVRAWRGASYPQSVGPRAKSPTRLPR